ncbi:peptidase family M28-domain-containing protein [Corynascus similis CBS 632.67]
MGRLAPLLWALFLTHAHHCTLAYTPLSDNSLRHLVASSPSSSDLGTTDPDLDPADGALLAPILQPRVPGTPGHAAVQEHFAAFARNHLEPAGWTVEWHNTTAATPALIDEGGRERVVPFRNLILRRDPPWVTSASSSSSSSEKKERETGNKRRRGQGDVARLTLAAHYDSLYRPEGFIGAVDSAVPCALLLFVARAIDGALTKRWEAEEKAAGKEDEDMLLLEDEEEPEKGMQILLLDGEEAWVEWSERDSLYGSRALAEAWEDTQYEAGSSFSTPLEAISLFVLLDLLGAPEPNIPSYFPKTHWAYEKLAKLEERLRKLDLLETKPRKPFLAERGQEARRFSGFVQDDHVPFMRRGVNILHIIPTPFPPVWHTMDDDGAHLDAPTIRDWARIMTAFVAEWMDLEGYLPDIVARSERNVEDTGKGPAEKEEL